MINLQIVSDLHLEFRGNNFTNIIKPSAPILCLLGDICACGNDNDFNVYKNFIQFISTKFMYIFHVPGNHEYYATKSSSQQNTMHKINLKIRAFLKKYNNIFYMTDNMVQLNINQKNYVFIGSTLWTCIQQKDKKMISNRMNDYYNIYMPINQSDVIVPNSKILKLQSETSTIRRYNVEDMSYLHNKSVRFINRSIKKLNKTDIGIILTHHKPYRSKPITDIISQAYETGLIGSVIKLPSNIKVWGYGHTHVKDDTKILHTRIVSNPKGYPSQKTLFKSDFTVDV